MSINTALQNQSDENADDIYPSTDVLTPDEWNEICPCCNQYPAGFQMCLPYFLATLVQHYDWIMQRNLDNELINISVHHPIFQSRVFTSGIIPRLWSMVMTNNINGRCDVTTGMTASGVPPHIDT